MSPFEIAYVAGGAFWATAMYLGRPSWVRRLPKWEQAVGLFCVFALWPPLVAWGVYDMWIDP